MSITISEVPVEGVYPCQHAAGLIIGGALSFKINPKRPLAAACLMAGFQAIPMLVMLTNAPM